MRLRGLDELSFSFVPIPAGTWWILREEDVKWSITRMNHPWILHVDFTPRTAFAHACPRTRSRSADGCEHDAHVPGHEPMCQLDCKGWVLPQEARQILPEWFDNGWRSCEEAPESDLLERIRARLVPGA
jgi:hypothetical protein